MRLLRCACAFAAFLPLPILSAPPDGDPQNPTTAAQTKLEQKSETHEKTRTVSEIAKAVKPSLVKVTQFGREGASGMGSGFVLSAEGLVATNRHVIGDGRRLSVETSDGTVHEVTEVHASDTRLDLAILRIAPKNLKALPLGDSDSLHQGDPIVAMGNPVGFDFSVVEGVVSEPARDVEGVPMIQVAIPVEQGNSGGPLLDRQGRVVGLVTLKSARTENLGFAMPVNALKKLLEKPNPVPIERWLTIGVLNPRLWSTRMGAQWTQRAGLVSVAQPGSGFGGRSLCLWRKRPADSFDASVTVKLDDEAGAAGLAFCADEEDRHYGFYPTAGKLRLTRFDGPDVFSWKILAELEAPAYLPGDWNTLHVRLEGSRIRCSVNDTEVLNIEDDGLRGGRVGLCKFRSTSASFKGFQTGASTASQKPDAESAATLRSLLESGLQDDQSREAAMSQLLKQPEAAGRAIEQRRSQLEKEAILLREMGGELHRRTVREQLASELAKPDASTDLLRCTLLLARHDNPELEIQSYEEALAQMAQELRADPEIAAGTTQAVQRISRFLFQENGFHGSRTDFTSRSNSYLNEVLDDREGLPITLSVVFLELARRLEVPRVAGIPLPGRFMVGYKPQDNSPYTLIDVFEGGKEMTMEEALTSIGGEDRISASAMKPALKRDILLRMIHNLLGPLRDARSLRREALPYLDLTLALEPDAIPERFSRAVLRERLADKRGARADVMWLLEHPPEELPEEQQRSLRLWMERLQ